LAKIIVGLISQREGRARGGKVDSKPRPVEAHRKTSLRAAGKVRKERKDEYVICRAREGARKLKNKRGAAPSGVAEKRQCQRKRGKGKVIRNIRFITAKAAPRGEFRVANRKLQGAQRLWQRRGERQRVSISGKSAHL